MAVVGGHLKAGKKTTSRALSCPQSSPEKRASYYHPMKTIKVKAVIFDMDGVITDTMSYHFRVWRRIYAAEGFRVTKEEIYLREGQPGYRTIKEIFGERGIPFDEARARRILAEKERLLRRIVRKRFYPRVRGFPAPVCITRVLPPPW
jgi:hypothetical protein